MKLLTTIGLLLSALFACQQKETAFQSLSTDEFATLITDPDVQRLDVRTVAEYSEGHIPGSLNINVLDEASFGTIADSTLTKEKPVALYCRSGHPEPERIQGIRPGQRIQCLGECRKRGGAVTIPAHLATGHNLPGNTSQITSK